MKHIMMHTTALYIVGTQQEGQRHWWFDTPFENKQTKNGTKYAIKQQQ